MKAWRLMVLTGCLCVQGLGAAVAPETDPVETAIAEALGEEPVTLISEADAIAKDLDTSAAKGYASARTAQGFARKGNIAEAEAIMQECLQQKGLTPNQRANLLFQTFQLYDPLVGLPRDADLKTQLANRAKAVEWLKQAAAVTGADKPVRWKMLTTLFDTCFDLKGAHDLTLAARVVSDLEGLPGLTDKERLTLGDMRMTVAQEQADYPVLAQALDRAIPLTTNLLERTRLQLRCGDIASAFLKDKEKAVALWHAVATNDTTHAYYRAVAMEKIAHAAVYLEPYPNHLLASFPERRAVPKERVVSERLDEALGWWRKILSLPLANWVKLDALAGMARACQSCGKPKEGLALLETHALTLPALNVRQTAEVKFIMAQLAVEAGDTPRAAALCREAAAVEFVRPQLGEAARKLASESEGGKGGL